MKNQKTERVLLHTQSYKDMLGQMPQLASAFEVGKKDTKHIRLWLQVSGPFITLVALFLLEIVSKYVLIPNPTTLYLIFVGYSAFSGGLYSGLISAIIAVLYTLYISSQPGEFLRFSPENIQRILVLAMSAPLIAFMIGILRERTQTLLFEKEARLRAEATAEMIRRLQSVTDVTLANTKLADLLRALPASIKTLLGVDFALISLQEKKVDTATFDGNVARIETKSFAAQVLQERKPLAITEGGSKRSLLGVPLLIEGNAIGVLEVGTQKARHFTKEDTQLLQLVADRAALAIDRAYQFQKAQEAVRVRDEFLSIASHELRTPLTSMLLQVQSVLKSVREQSLANFSVEKMMQKLESAEEQSKRLAKLIRDLLNVSLITSGRLELELEEVDIVDLVKTIVTRFEDQLNTSGSQVTIQETKPLKTYADRLRIEQVVTNLLSNAIKYGGGKPIEISISKEDRNIRIVVADHGIGIAPEKIQQVFNRFERAVSAKEYKGLGVGLYIANQIVSAHHGTIRVESTPKRGSTFIVELPIATAS